MVPDQFSELVAPMRLVTMIGDSHAAIGVEGLESALQYFQLR